MPNTDFSTLLDVNSMIISSNPKDGKMTFLVYLVSSFYKEKAIIFTPQESYLFNRKLNSLSKQFVQLSDINNSITPYYLKEDWHSLKQKYGYTFFLQELGQIIIKSKEKIIVFHRIAEFFEFQDRYEIENIYKSVVRIAEVHDKKIIFLVNEKNDNFKYVYQVAEEFSDVAISITTNTKNERLLNIKNMLRNTEYPVMNFRIHENIFLLDYQYETEQIVENKIKNVLIAEIDKAHDNMRQICTYIFDKPGFKVKHADSLQSMLQEIFIRPDIIIVLMKRSQRNLETIKAIKLQLPSSAIVTILDQDFIRAEDIHELYHYGCDEVFANNLSFDKAILTLQKASKTLFYTHILDTLPKHKNIMSSIDEFKALATECTQRSIFFTAFTLESKKGFSSIKSTSRHTDFIYHTKNKLFYLAISTMPKDIFVIINKFKEKTPDLTLTCVWEPINNTALEECIL